MGTYLRLEAKRGCEEQINEAYAAHRSDPRRWLIYSDRVIREQIAFIHSPEAADQAHLRPYLKTPADWPKIFPSCRRGTGEIKLSGLDFSNPAVRSRIQVARDIAFVLEHRMLFSRIDGLDDARSYALTEFLGDRIEHHKVLKRESEGPAFADLPRSRSRIYRRCVEHNRPDLWQAYLVFKKTADEASWLLLRDKTVPWNPRAGSTVWQLIERRAVQEDGRECGLLGRFRDGVFPSFWFVRWVLEQS